MPSPSRPFTSRAASPAASAPKPIAAIHCQASCDFASGTFRAQSTSSHVSTAGKATLEPAAV